MVKIDKVIVMWIYFFYYVEIVYLEWCDISCEFFIVKYYWFCWVRNYREKYFYINLFREIFRLVGIVSVMWKFLIIIKFFLFNF